MTVLQAGSDNEGRTIAMRYVAGTASYMIVNGLLRYDSHDEWEYRERLQKENHEKHP